ncbi:hypothetical protein GTW51_05655 [Aurantimonas aggregata]|uniref:Uncharacterized protein n=1 Tax=Aurantimonas aggregata TaxID=2047720 RepID=A0A6L9MEA5_9HYPH|nr:hypothetical protein [Aurantimonas aggregata]NDV86184.1 hypothetical protein [Aurantimonas aggregata]
MLKGGRFRAAAVCVSETCGPDVTGGIDPDSVAPTTNEPSMRHPTVEAGNAA